MYQPHDKEEFKEIILSRLEEVKNYQDLQKIFHSIKNNEKFLKSERGGFMKAFGQYGATTTWVSIMEQFEAKALETAAQELDSTMVDYQELITPERSEFVSDQFRRRYLPFFYEQTGRIFQSGAAEKLKQIIDEHFMPKASPHLKAGLPSYILYC